MSSSSVVVLLAQAGKSASLAEFFRDIARFKLVSAFPIFSELWFQVGFNGHQTAFGFCSNGFQLQSFKRLTLKCLSRLFLLRDRYWWSSLASMTEHANPPLQMVAGPTANETAAQCRTSRQALQGDLPNRFELGFFRDDSHCTSGRESGSLPRPRSRPSTSRGLQRPRFPTYSLIPLFLSNPPPNYPEN